MDYLVHHGIKGQKWGVRRYQNPDGTLTPEGRKHYGVGDSQVVRGYNSPYKTKLQRPKRARVFGVETAAQVIYKKEKKARSDFFDKKRSSELKRTASDVESILSSMSDKDLALLNIHRNDIKYYSSNGYDFVKRFVLKDSSGIPVSFLDFQDDFGVLNVVVGTRGEPEYRQKGYAAKVTKKGLDWVDKNAEYLDYPYSGIQWQAYYGNTGSRKLAKRSGFNLEYAIDDAYSESDSDSDNKYWSETSYARKVKSKSK